MFKEKFYLMILILMVGAAGSSGGLTVIGTATYDGTDYNLVWDDDDGGGNQVVYLDYDYSVGRWINHPDAISWAGGLGAALTINLLPGHSVTWSGDWRLPAVNAGIELGDLDNADCPDAYTLMDAWPAPAFNRFWVGMSATGHIYQQPGSCGSGGSILQHDNPNDYDNGAIAVRSVSEVSTGPTIEFVHDSSGDLESITPALVEVILNDALVGETYTVDYAVIGGTATGGGVDYTLAAGTLTFLPDSTSELISIDIVDDGTPEADETIVIELSNPIGLDLQLGAPTQHTYTILDPMPSVGFDEAGSSGMENVTPVYVAVSLSIPAPQTVTVDYDVTGGTATGGGVDYTLDPGTLTFNIDDVTKDIVIDIVSDANEQEPAETIIIGLSNPTGANLGSTIEYTYTIVSQTIDIKVDFALVYCPDTSTIRPESAKPGWWHWAAEGWADMYMHDLRWENGSMTKPTDDGIDGTGIHACITTGSEGQLGLHMKDLCRDNLGGGGCPYGNPAGDPIANTFLYAVDWAGPSAGDILLMLTDMPPGEYWLYSYHNHWEPCSQGTRNCLQCECGMPPMPTITANPAPSSPPAEYNGYSLPLGTGTGVTQIENAYNVWPTHYYLDSELVPSLIKFETDGSMVLVIYEADNTLWPDCARDGREGTRGILNAFELIWMGPGGPDTNPPSPDPMTWATPPYSTGASSIAMVATTATDASGVEYYFDCTSGGGNDSGWQDTTSYEDTGLSPETQYCYAVQARDKSPNQNATAASTPPACATTDAVPDTTPPSPDPMTWATPPYSTGTTSIAMLATTAIDVSGVEYYFDCTSGGGNDSGWQDSTSYEDTGLSPDTQYCYVVQARDKSPNQNATAWSSPAACATTDAVPDTTPPSPDPMTWATPPYSTGTTSIAMVATTATDDSGVEYYFQCTSGGGNDSGWQDSTSYEDTGLSPDTQYCYAVQARDKSPNQNATAFSTPAACATTDALPDTTPPSPDPMTWATPPYSTGTSSIAMVATTATDDSGVEYYFTCTSGGGNDSAWQDSTSYTDTGLSPDTQYCYTVQARDKSPNQNATASSTPPACATTDALPDTAPPTPNPATFASPPAAVSSSEITMTATTGSDASPPVQYFFDETSGNPGGSDSGWVTNPVYNDTGLDPNTEYTYTVQMRDSLLNTGAASAPASATTPPACTPATTHVESILCEAVRVNPPKSYGRATVTIYDNCGNPVVGADVTGTFSGDFSEQLTETTDASGVAVLVTTTDVKKPSFTFCVDAVAHATLTYNAGDNVETCDSN